MFAVWVLVEGTLLRCTTKASQVVLRTSRCSRSPSSRSRYRARNRTIRSSRTSSSSSITTTTTARVTRRPHRLNDAADVGSQLRHGGVDLGGEEVAEGLEGAHLAAGELVHAADALGKLARVDVRVAAVLDVLDQQVGDARAGFAEGRGGGVDGAEGFGEGLAGRVSFLLLDCAGSGGERGGLTVHLRGLPCLVGQQRRRSRLGP